MARSTLPTRTDSYKWHSMGDKSLKYDVKCRGTVVIPAGAKNVDIAFGQSFLTYIDDNGKIRHMNVYRYNGKIYHG